MVNEKEKIISYGKGVKITGLQLRVVFHETDQSLLQELKENLLADNITRIKLYGNPTDSYMVDRNMDLDIKLSKADSISTHERMEIHKQASELYQQYAPWESKSRNAMFQFILEDDDGYEFFLNTGSIRSDHLEYIVDDLWTTVDVYQGWVDHDKESTSGT